MNKRLEVHMIKPVRKLMSEKIRLAHGFGGKLSQDLLNEIIHPAISGNEERIVTLDAVVLNDLEAPVVVSTDSYTIAPRFFPGGDIGKLAVIGTVNDIAMMGGQTKYLSLGLIIEEGFEIEELRRIMTSIGETCRRTGAKVVTGDTKVVEKGVIDGKKNIIRLIRDLKKHYASEKFINDGIDFYRKQLDPIHLKNKIRGYL